MLLNYHTGRLVLSSLCVGDLVRLVLCGVRFAGFSLQEEIADLSEESAASTLGTSKFRRQISSFP